MDMLETKEGAESMNRPEVGKHYRHFKGGNYEIVAIATHTETGETLVIYKALYGEAKVYARPLEMFVERVDPVKYPDATQVRWTRKSTRKQHRNIDLNESMRNRR